jgi:diguanylate cyclase (GGDEF)-like protein
VWESPAGWALGSHLPQFVPPGQRAQLQAALGAVASGVVQRVNLECPVVDDAGQWRPADWTVFSGEGLSVPGAGAEARVLVAVHELGETFAGERSGVPPTSVDDLTGLGDRLALNARLRAAEDIDEPDLAVFYVDVDRFKTVNDEFGHSTGDQVLLAVADRLRATVRPGDLVTRIGGDEFVVVAGPLANPDSALEIAERIRMSASTPVQSAGRKATATVSIGVALGPGREASQLLEKADAALYRAKELGRDRAQLFSEHDRAMRQRATGPIELLRSALDDGLVVVYERVIDLATDRLSGVEASLRIRDVAGRLGDPTDLLRVAERSGLIVALGAGMLDLACRDISSWAKCQHKVPGASTTTGPDWTDWPGGLTWPVTARQLDDPKACEQVLYILENHDLAPERLTLQIKETGLLQQGSNPRRNLDQLRRNGVSLSISDFGSGPGGLSSLLDLAFDVFELDAAFMAAFGEDRHTDDVVDAILTMARTLGVRTVARGVRSRSQAELLRHMGCDAALGPLFGPARTADDFVAESPVPDQEGGRGQRA